jgi:hypothetical protein
VAGLRVVHAAAVEEDEGLGERGAADGEVALEAVGGALAEVEGGVELEEIREVVEQEALGEDGEGGDGAVGLFEGERLPGSGDDDGLLDGGWSGGLSAEQRGGGRAE